MIISLDRRISHYAPDLSGNSQIRNYFVYHDRSCLIRLFLYIYIYIYLYTSFVNCTYDINESRDVEISQGCVR